MQTVIELFDRAVQSGWMKSPADCWENFINSGEVPLTPGEREAFDLHIAMQQTRSGPLPLHLFPEEVFISGEWFRQFAERPDIIEAGERWFNTLRERYGRTHHGR